MDYADRSRHIALHNLYLLKTEIETCKEAIVEGRLWDLVEERAAAHPRLYEAFLEFTKRSGSLRDGTRFIKDRGLMVKGELDLLRPEVTMSEEMLAGAARRDRKTALLIVGAENLPGGRLRYSSQEFEPGGCDTYRVHPFLGAYPIELDFVYPFTQSVSAAPVDSSDAEARAVLTLKRRGYSRVFVAVADDGGKVLVRRSRSRRKRRGPYPSPLSTSSRSR
jgi:7-cyano-7-deazaguanine tRNA-ribosyltransferase